MGGQEAREPDVLGLEPPFTCASSSSRSHDAARRAKPPLTPPSPCSAGGAGRRVGHASREHVRGKCQRLLRSGGVNILSAFGDKFPANGFKNTQIAPRTHWGLRFGVSGLGFGVRGLGGCKASAPGPKSPVAGPKFKQPETEGLVQEANNTQKNPDFQIISKTFFDTRLNAVE